MGEDFLPEIIKDNMSWIDIIPSLRGFKKGTAEYKKSEKEVIKDITNEVRKINPHGLNVQNRIKAIMGQIIVLKAWGIKNKNVKATDGLRTDYLIGGKKGEFKMIFSAYPYKNGLKDNKIMSPTQISSPSVLSNYQSNVDEASYSYVNDLNEGNIIIYRLSSRDLEKVVNQNFNKIKIDFLNGEIDYHGNRKIMMHIPPEIIDKIAKKVIIFKSK